MPAASATRTVSPSVRRPSPVSARADAARQASEPVPQPAARDSSWREPDTKHLWTAYLKDRSAEIFNELVKAYAPYVQRVAARVAKRLPPSVDPDDLCASGNFGLMDAIGSFDPTRGVKFQTFALKRIMGAMSDSLRAQDIAPRLARRREAQVKKARDDFRKLHGRTPTEEELLRLLHSDEEEARSILEGAAIPNIGSMSAPSDDSDAGKGRAEANFAVPDHRAPAVAPRLPVPSRDMQRWLGRGLSQSERLIIWLYYFESLTMKEIGQTLGICEGRVSQIHALLLERLRARMVREQEDGE